jgi:anthranilate synthase component 2
MSRLLVIDNYDSFTWNLVHLLGPLVSAVEVVRNDETSAEAVVAAEYDAVIMSPGPCTPNEAGICLDLVRRAGATGAPGATGTPGPTGTSGASERPEAAVPTVPPGGAVPLFGVCLGLQAIGQAFGGEVVRAPEPVHGKVAEIRHEGRTVFRGINGPLKATRYHSLVVARDTCPADLAVTAETADGLVMGLSHRTLPIHGVQFHPESIASEHGETILRNFLDLAAAWNRAERREPALA